MCIEQQAKLAHVSSLLDQGINIFNFNSVYFSKFYIDVLNYIVSFKKKIKSRDVQYTSC